MANPLARKKIQKLIIYILMLMVFVVAIGFIAYRYFFNTPPIDAFFYSVLTITTIGNKPIEPTTSEKLFTSFYALFSSLLFLSLVASVVSYVLTSYIENEPEA